MWNFLRRFGFHLKRASARRFPQNEEEHRPDNILSSSDVEMPPEYAPPATIINGMKGTEVVGQEGFPNIGDNSQPQGKGTCNIIESRNSSRSPGYGTDSSNVPNTDVMTSAKRSLLGDLDGIYPESMTNPKIQEDHDRYNFTMRRWDLETKKRGGLRLPAFEWYEGRFWGREPPPAISQKGETFEVDGKSFRLFERIARGSAHVIIRSQYDSRIRGMTYTEWAHDEWTRENILPCFDLMRDAAECMVEVLLAALDGYKKGYHDCLWALMHQRAIYSDSDPNYRYSLGLLHDWTKYKYRDEPYICKLDPSKIGPQNGYSTRNATDDQKSNR